jgi:opacity protein-like surface antigen
MSSTIQNRGSQRWSLAASLHVSLLFLLGLFLAPGSASAKSESFARTGVYLGLSGVYTNNFFDDQIDDAFSDLIGGSVDVDIDDSRGLNARVGYRAASFIAFELQYEWIDNFETEITAPSLPGQKAKIDITGHSLTLNAKLIIPTWRIQPYFLLGAGYSLYESDTSFSPGFSAIPGIGQVDGGKESGFAARGGAGIDWYITRHIVVNTEVTALITTQDFSAPDTGSIDNLYYLSMGVGLQYRF